MKYCVLSLLLGCSSYQNLSQPQRNRAFTPTNFPTYPQDDGSLVGHWWRFVGIGGDRIITSCIGTSTAGTIYPISAPFSLPQSVESPYVGSSCTRSSTSASCCEWINQIEILLCPGQFYVFKPNQHQYGSSAYVTYHSNCTKASCGLLAECTGDGGCVCVSGYRIPSNHKPSEDSYGCQDIDECVETSSICGPDSKCNNTAGGHTCICLKGYKPTEPNIQPSQSNTCKDIDECTPGICDVNGTCENTPGSYTCTCNQGYHLNDDASTECQDINECFNSTVCGPDSVCSNTAGSHTCTCLQGYEPSEPNTEPSEINACQDVDECVTEPTICGPDANCTNSIGAYTCTCYLGYRLTNPDAIASNLNPCQDIDECGDSAGPCGPDAACANAPGTFFCSCQDGFFPSTGVLWETGVSVCRSVQDILDSLKPPAGQTKEKYFLTGMDQQLKDNLDTILPEGMVTNGFSTTLKVSGVAAEPGQAVKEVGDRETGSLVLGISERLVSALVEPTQNQTNRTIQTPKLHINVQVIGPGAGGDDNTTLSAKGNTMEINLQALARNNNGSAAAVFMSASGMEDLLSSSYFQTKNQTEMYSDVITATLPKINHTQLSQPVNFTIRHKRRLSESGLVTCVYWEDSGEKKGEKQGDGGGEEEEEEEKRHWSVEGCWAVHSDENYTVCSCSHLSTFALILQTGETAVDDPFLEWVNRVSVCVGLIFFALAILTFLLCSWNPKINNTARLHLCICLFLSHLLLLMDEAYVDNGLICSVMAGLLHFLVLASFVWMLLEAVQLHLLVWRLTKVQVIERDGLPKPCLYLIGYGVPTVIVGVSAWVNSEGYGGPKMCWLSKEKNFTWALTGPVIAVLALNWILFCFTIWSLRPTLANMRSDVSQSKDTRLIVFKILAQFVILGCTWILGFYQTNLFFQYLFVLLNSQQGTFLYIVHCLLNKEVRAEYYRCLTCSFNSPRTVDSVREAPSISEDLDKIEERRDVRKD